jgi:hypothetical protein
MVTQAPVRTKNFPSNFFGRVWRVFGLPKAQFKHARLMWLVFKGMFAHGVKEGLYRNLLWGAVVVVYHYHDYFQLFVF